ncbi:MAG TPA: hypothetical protein ENO22_01690 [candidate division Zixibacteria bacterium]|nr:hypothetical protein [candidate division Zixibacteria bacterium]HEQ98034.1 hypothetical protein [candidate division Zixibacteria bacterium]
MKKAPLVILILSILLTTSIISAASTTMQVRIYIDSKAQLSELRSLHLDIVYRQDNYVEIITDAEELEELQALDFRTEVIHEDLVAFYQSRLAPKDMGGYMTLSEINAKTDSLVDNFPDIVSQKYNLGQTIEGRDMWAIKISDNPDVDEDEPEVFYTAAIHAREVITPLVLFNFADSLTQKYSTDTQIQNLVDNREIWFCFCVNPDGYYYNEYTDPGGGGMWRKNRRHNFDGSYGVDLNRNFGYEWGYDDEGSSPVPSDATYRGTMGFSEPETQNMRDFHYEREFILSVYFHSYSDLILWPWGYDQFYTEDQDIFQVMGDSIATWNGYAPSPAWGLYVANGTTDDWIYGEQTYKNKTFAFTFEVGGYWDGFWPSVLDIPELVNENYMPLMFLTEVAGSVYQLRAPVAPQIFAPDSIDEGEDIIVFWTFEDTLNPAVEFELVELTGQQEITDYAENFDYCQNNDFILSSARSYSGLYSFFSGAENNIYRYVEYEFPFPVEAGDSLKFYTWYDTELDWDYGYVEVAAGSGPFTAIEGNITTTYDPHGNNRGHGITGSSYGWVLGKFSLEDFVGQNIRVRLSYETDAYTTDEGIYFDDIYPITTFENESFVTLPSDDASYMFPDKIPGMYHYKIRAKDAEDQWGAYSPIDGTQVYALPTYICGDANADETVNVSDAVAIINYVFVGAAAPDPMESADTNCDAAVNVSDAVMIINYVFIGGNDPCDPDGDSIPDC